MRPLHDIGFPALFRRLRFRNDTGEPGACGLFATGHSRDSSGAPSSRGASRHSGFSGQGDKVVRDRSFAHRYSSANSRGRAHFGPMAAWTYARWAWEDDPLEDFPVSEDEDMPDSGTTGSTAVPPVLTAEERMATIMRDLRARIGCRHHGGGTVVYI